MYEKPTLKYFTGEEAEQFTFYRIPKRLFTDDYFRSLSTDAKVLYGLMLDRVGLSVKNHWVDDNNHVYIYFSVEDTMEYLNCRKNKAIQVIAELDSEKGIGLIERRRQGQGKPSLIYVKNFFISVESDAAKERNAEKSAPSEVGKTNFWKFEKQTSGCLKNKPLEVGKTNPNKNKRTDIERSDIQSDQITAMSEENHSRAGLLKYDARCIQDSDIETTKRKIQKQIEYDWLLKEFPYDRELLDGICDLILEVQYDQSQDMVIAKSRQLMPVVKERFGRLNADHIRYVVTCLHKNTTRIRNIRRYLLTALFNAPATIDGYYLSEVNYDMAHPAS